MNKISRNRYSHLLLCAVFLLLPVQAFAVLWSAPQPSVEVDGVIVKFKDAVSQTSRAHALSSSGLKHVKSFSLIKGLTHARIVQGQSVASTIAVLSVNPNVEYVEPNYFVTIDAVIPNDPNFSKQYGLNNDGSNGAIANADINAPEAWEMQTGTDVVVAVVDTGVDHLHPDLKDNMWRNPGEIEGNGIDDDNNGFIDDVYGWNFADNTSTPIDDHAHGTHVAGVIAAKGNNGIGIAGVNWNARIMGLKFIGADGIGSTVNAISAINYAVRMGARISNNSWGGGGFSQALVDTIKEAHRQGHLFVAAAGNDGVSTDITPHYPSSYDVPNIISVAATDDADNLAGFSNYGVRTVDLAAPGFRIESTIPNGLYQALSGTSMAAPFVAGAAAMLLAADPDMSVEKMVVTILDNVDVLPALSGKVAKGGRLNLLKMLSTVAVKLTVVPKSIVLSVGDSQQFSAQGGARPYTWRIEDSTVGQIDSQSGALTALAEGATQIVVSDANGVTARSGDIVVAVLSVTPSNATVQVGQTLNFSVSGGQGPYDWQSSDPGIGVIDSVSGLFEGLSLGRVEVTVLDSNGITATSDDIDVVILPQMTLTPEAMIIFLGESDVFRVQGGAPPYEWSSSNPLVASIDVNGVLVAESLGTSTVQATDATGESATGSVEVVGDSVRINPTVTELGVNESVQIIAEGGVPPYQWRVTNSRVASIDNNGFLIGKTPGSIKVVIIDSSGVANAKAQSDAIVVKETAVLAMNPETGLLKLGEIIAATVSGGAPPYRWQVSDTTILSANSVNSTVEALNVGTTTIAIEDSTGNRIRSGSFEVRDIMVRPQVAALMIGGTLQFSATGGKTPYIWSLNTNSSARIDSRSGLLTASAAGTVVVIARDVEGVSGSSNTISVGAAIGANINPLTVSPQSATVSRRGRGIEFLARGGLSPYTFSLSNKNAGQITEKTGLFTPNEALQTEVTTNIIVVDANGYTIKSGIVAVK